MFDADTEQFLRHGRHPAHPRFQCPGEQGVIVQRMAGDHVLQRQAIHVLHGNDA